MGKYQKMFLLYDLEYTHELDGDNLIVCSVETGVKKRIGIHYLPVILSLESNKETHPNWVESLYAELTRNRTVRNYGHEIRQLKDVKVYYPHQDGLYKHLKMQTINVTDDPSIAAYHLSVPLTYTTMEFRDMTTTKILVMFGVHGTKVSPLVYPQLGLETYKERRSKVKSFCFNNFSYINPSYLTLSWAAAMIKQHICYFTLERKGFQFTPEIGSLIEFNLPENVV